MTYPSTDPVELRSMLDDAERRLTRLRQQQTTQPGGAHMAIESKVIAATAGSGAGAAVSAFVLWLLGITVWHVPNSADSAGDAIAAVPTPVAGIIGIGITVATAFAAGYAAPHTPKPVDPPADPNT